MKKLNPYYTPKPRCLKPWMAPEQLSERELIYLAEFAKKPKHAEAMRARASGERLRAIANREGVTVQAIADRIARGVLQGARACRVEMAWAIEESVKSIYAVRKIETGTP